MFGSEIQFSGADSEGLGATDVSLKLGVGTMDGEGLVGGGGAAVTIVIVNLIPKFNGEGSVEIDGIEDDKNAGPNEDDGASDAGNGKACD